MAAKNSIIIKIFGILAILALVLSALAPVFYAFSPAQIPEVIEATE